MKILPLIQAAILIFLMGKPVLGQVAPTSKISGEVVDENGVGMPQVNVLLLKAPDSTLVEGAVANNDGHYIFEKVPNGQYLILASMVGFSKGGSKVVAASGKDISIETIRLAPNATELNEVGIEAKKPFIEQQVDRLVVNVANSIVSAGATALEVLERSPGVTVDQQNQILKLRGKEGIIVQIDGKQTYLSQQELINLLKNTPSDNIEKIELITNPSAKYDAAGNSGIINIKFKKNVNHGTNGSVSVGSTVAFLEGPRPRGNGSLNLNHRQGKLSVFGTLSRFENNGYNENDILRKNEYDGQTSYFEQFASRAFRGNYTSIRAGIDYNLTEKTTVGVLFNGFRSHFRNPWALSETGMLNAERQLTQRFTTESKYKGNSNNLSFNANLKHQFDDKGQELTFDVDYVNYDNSEANQLDTRYYNPEGNQKGPVESIRNNMPSEIHISVAKLDYVRPIGKGKFETGLKSSYVKSDNNMIFENYFDAWQIDPSRTNHFQYDENINAAYANYAGELGPKTKYQLGLRLEHTYSLGNSVTLDQQTKRNYVNLFPSAFISRTLDSSNTINLSYSYRIDRPNYESLNPFEYYLDPYTFERGNPYLKPMYTHAIQIAHMFKNVLNTTLAYNRTTDMIAEEVPEVIPAENKTYLITQNLDNQDYISLTISSPVTIKKWWNLQTNLVAAYNRFSTVYRGEPYDVRQLSLNVNANNQFSIGETWTVELSGWYNSPTVYGMFKSAAQGMVSVGIQKSFLEKKATLRLNMNDIFWTNKFHGITRFADVDLDVRSRWPSRQLAATFTYNFGNQKIKTRERQTGSDDLQKRAGGNN